MTAKRISRITRATVLFLALLAALPGCTRDDEKLATPATVFDETTPDPRSDAQKITDFIVKLERKYKRDERKNAIDLHFMESGPGRVKVRLTYDRTADPTTVSSIADAAIELGKRLKREDKSVRDLTISFERETVRREE